MGLLTSLRSAAGALDAAVVASISAYEALPAEERSDAPDCAPACLHEEPAAVVDATAPHPPHLEGHRASHHDGQLFFFGGYSCLDAGVMSLGGDACFSSDLWVLNLTSHEWTQHTRPTDATDSQYSLWPSPRAYHAQAVYDGCV